MSAGAQVDWFSQNAPQQEAKGADWFETNAPKPAAPAAPAAPKPQSKPALARYEDAAARSLGYDTEKIQNQPGLSGQWKEFGRETIGNLAGIGRGLLHDPSGATSIEGMATQVESGLRKLKGGQVAEGLGEMTGPAAMTLAPEAKQGALDTARNVENVASLPAETGKAIGRGVSDTWNGAKNLMSRAVREPGKYTPDPSVPPTRGALRPWAKVGVGPMANIGPIMDTITPAREPIVQPISHSPNYPLIKAGARAAAKPPAEVPPGPMGLSTSPESVSAIPRSALPAIAKGAMPSAGDVTSTGAMPAAPLGTTPPKPAPPGPAGISTAGFRGEGLTVPPPLPEAALPAMAKGVMSSTGDMSSTGAMPTTPLGTPEAAAAKAAAIKKGLGDIASAPRATGSEGTGARWTNERVEELAGKGDRTAITQAIRRGFELPENARYVMGDADYPRAVLNPREVTRFTPEGTPIRNTDNPIAQSPSSKALIQKPEMPAARVEPPAAVPPEEKPNFEAFKPEPEAIAKGVQAETAASKTSRAPRAKVAPVAQRYAPDIVGQAEDEMRGALELSDTLPAAGRYFAENTFEEHPLAGRYNVKAGERPGGTWSGIGSQKGNIAGQYPWFNDPEISASKLRNAISQGKGALYERIVGKIAEGITKERSAATASISEHIPELRDLASHVQEIEPELAQTLNDLADGKIELAPDKLKSYVTEKITDATAAAQFAREIDDAAAESRQASVPEARATPDPARPGSGEAGPAAQAPELKSPEGILPGMESAVAQQRIAAGVEQGRQLTEKLNAPPQSIEAAAGEMERKSPLFRGTEASPQRELLPPRQATEEEHSSNVTRLVDKVVDDARKFNRTPEEAGQRIRRFSLSAPQEQQEALLDAAGKIEREGLPTREANRPETQLSPAELIKRSLTRPRKE